MLGEWAGGGLRIEGIQVPSKGAKDAMQLLFGGHSVLLPPLAIGAQGTNDSSATPIRPKGVPPSSSKTNSPGPALGAQA